MSRSPREAAGAYADILAVGASSSMREYRQLFSWWSWLFGWLVRLLSQVAFFALLGVLLGAAADVRFIAVGNAAALAAIGALFVSTSTSRERQAGTLQYLLLAQGSMPAVLASRGLYWVLDAWLTAGIALAAVPLLVGGGYDWTAFPAVLAVLALVAVSAYAFGLTLASVALMVPGLRNVITGLATVVFLTVCGVNVDLAALPAAFSAVAQVLPLTHGLQAVRSLLDGNGLIVAALAAEAGVVLLWSCACVLATSVGVRQLVSRGRLAV